MVGSWLKKCSSKPKTHFTFPDAGFGRTFWMSRREVFVSSVPKSGWEKEKSLDFFNFTRNSRKKSCERSISGIEMSSTWTYKLESEPELPSEYEQLWHSYFSDLSIRRPWKEQDWVQNCAKFQFLVGATVVYWHFEVRNMTKSRAVNKLRPRLEWDSTHLANKWD